MRIFRIIKRILFFVITCVLVCSVVACSDKSKLDLSDSISLYGTPSFLKNGKTYCPWEYISVTNFCYRALFVAQADTDEIVPDMVDKYEISDDGLHYYMTLKDDLIWSDGEVIDLEDVIFSFETALKIKEINTMFQTTFSYIKGATEYMKGEVDYIAGVEVVDDMLHIELEKPMNIFLSVLAQFAILPEHALNDEPISAVSTCDFWLDPVVSGMYKRGAFVPTEYLTYVFNECYTGEEPEIQTLYMRSDFSIDEIDYTTTSDVTQILEYRSMAGMKEYEVDASFYRYLLFKDVKNGIVDPVMNDSKLRQAIVFAINTEMIMNDIYYSSGSLLNTNFETYQFELSKSMIEECGYDFSRPLVILTPFVDAVSIDLMEAMAADLEAVGFTVTTIFGGNIYTDSYDMALNDLSTIDETQWYMEFDQRHELRINNFAEADAFDALLDELLATTDSKEQEEKLGELQSLSIELAYKFPMLTMNHKAYINKYKISVPSDFVFGNARYRYDMRMEDWNFVS